MKKKQGAAITEYLLIAVFFGFAMAALTFNMDSDILKRYFETSVGGGAADGSGKLTMKVMGE